MNLYNAYYKDAVQVVQAETSYQAQQRAKANFEFNGHRHIKGYDITVVLVEKDGVEVTHDGAEFG